MRHSTFTLLSLWLVIVLLTGCNKATPAPAQTPASSTTLTRTPAPAQTPRPQITATTTPASDVLTLSWWLPEFLSPKAPAPGGPLLTQYLADFESDFDNKIRVNPVLKARYGKGGLLDYLRTALPVAPGLLPDIITLDVGELELAVNLGLVQPLDGIISHAITPTLYPFALQEVQFDGRTMAIPLIADLEHVIYNRERVSQLPSTWTGALAEKIPYLFPVNTPPSPSITGLAEDIPHSFLSQYLSAGGTIDPKTRRLGMQDQALLRVLNFYRDARSGGLWPDNIMEIASPDEVWSLYAQGSADMALVNARRYLASRETLSNSGYAAAPGWSTSAAPVGGGWVLAIATADPARQKAAAALIAWLMAPERSGPLAQAIGWLPTSADALVTWGANPYFEFLDGQLAAAVAHPIGPEYVHSAARLQKAIAAVVKGNSTPAEAVQTAVSPK
jgi:ABC-type glycerol-3-phosphate transport system substrate-binding protein